MDKIKLQINRIKLAIVASNSMDADNELKLGDTEIKQLLNELQLLNAKAYALSKAV